MNRIGAQGRGSDRLQPRLPAWVVVAMVLVGANSQWAAAELSVVRFLRQFEVFVTGGSGSVSVSA